MTLQPSPFKFLDAYNQKDAAVFFGREKETLELYNALSGVKQLLVYGPSGSGKTSLIECGLRNQFSDADWFALTIRRGTDINASIFAGINASLIEKIPLNTDTKMPVDPTIEFGQAVEQLFSERFQPIYLLFDQFEELLISGSEEEKKKFFILLHKLISGKLPCRILLIMREEFIGHLSEFEVYCPLLFQHRYRVEKMGRKNVEAVIWNMLEAPVYRTYFTVNDIQLLTDAILSKLPDSKKEIELAHVQVFLGELWDRALANHTGNKLPELNAGLIKTADDLETILDSFLKKQLVELDEKYGKNIALEILAAMITNRFTKLQVSTAALEEYLSNIRVKSPHPISGLLIELEQHRIIRSIKALDEIQFEISHDLLAQVVGQNRTEEMKMREKAKSIYMVYGERQGLFSEEDIVYLQGFEKYFPYPEILQQRIIESIAIIKKQQEKIEGERVRKIRRTKFLWVSVPCIVCFSAFLIYYYIEKKNDREKARESSIYQFQKNNSVSSGNRLLGLIYTSEIIALQKDQKIIESLSREAQKNNLIPEYSLVYNKKLDYQLSNATMLSDSTKIFIWTSDYNFSELNLTNDSILKIAKFKTIDSSTTLLINKIVKRLNFYSETTGSKIKDTVLFDSSKYYNRWFLSHCDTDTLGIKRYPALIQTVDGIAKNDKDSIFLTRGGSNITDFTSINIWDYNKDQIGTSLIYDEITGFNFSWDGKSIISWGSDSTLRIWKKTDKTNFIIQLPPDLIKMKIQIATGMRMNETDFTLERIPFKQYDSLKKLFLSELRKLKGQTPVF